ncbi:TPA: FeoB-associated Cys-rich membrane protein [Streptococcus suis]
MANFILISLIVVLFVLAIRSLVKSKGACNDCSCVCAIKQEISHQHDPKHSKIS